VQVISNNN